MNIFGLTGVQSESVAGAVASLQDTIYISNDDVSPMGLRYTGQWRIQDKGGCCYKIAREIFTSHTHFN